MKFPSRKMAQLKIISRRSSRAEVTRLDVGKVSGVRPTSEEMKAKGKSCTMIFY